MTRPRRDETVKPPCNLTGNARSIFKVVVRVDRALRDIGHTNQAEEFLERAVNCHTYAELVRLAREYVTIEEGTPHS